MTEVPSQTFSRCIRVGRVVGVGTLVSILLTSMAWASSLMGVRIGVHARYTRVVFQLDAPAPYELTGLRPVEDGSLVLTLTLAAGSPPADQVKAPRSPHVKAVRLRQMEDGRTEVRVRLLEDAELKEMVLSKPDRIVLDFYDPGAGVASRVSQLSPPPARGSEPRPAGLAVAPAPADDTGAATSWPAGDTGAVPEADVVAVAPASPPGAPPRDLAALRNEAFAPALEGAASPLPADADTPEGEVLGAAPGGNVEPRAPSAGLEPFDEGDAFAGVEIAEVQPEEHTPAPVASTRPGAAPSRGAGSLLGSPVVLAAVAGLAVIGLLFVIARRRRPATPDSLSPLDPARVEEAGPEPGLAVGGHSEEDAPREGEPMPMGEAPAEHDIEPEAVETVAELEPERPHLDDAADFPAISTGDTPPLESPSPFAPHGAGESAELGKLVEEFERRIAHLENRLEEVVDTKERLERQVAAQTEELRVQRAAIARTQRVLRTIARPEDEASEPAPKV